MKNSVLFGSIFIFFVSSSVSERQECLCALALAPSLHKRYVNVMHIRLSIVRIWEDEKLNERDLPAECLTGRQ